MHGFDDLAVRVGQDPLGAAAFAAHAPLEVGEVADVLADEGAEADDAVLGSRAVVRRREFPLATCRLVAEGEGVGVLGHALLTGDLPVLVDPALMMSVNLLVPPKEDTTTPPVLLNTPSFVEMPEQTEGGVTVNSAPSAIPDMARYSGNTDGLDAVLARFARAWAENDQATLLALTQDAQGRKYAGLGGWESGGNVNIDWVYQRVPDMTTDGNAYVQATFTIKQKVTPETVSGDDESLDPKEFTMTQTMDFLVHDVGGGLPAIVAWGPAGTWHNLEPYGNARDKEKSPEQVEGTGVRSPESDSNAPQQETSTSRGGGSGGGSSATTTERGDAFDAPPIDIGSGGGSSSDSTTTSEDLGVDDELCRELGVC